jgi:chromosome partitioning protein
MIIAVYSSKGGVGKTTLAVNLAWASATLSSRRTLLWDLDAQAAASYILGDETQGKKAQSSITRDTDPSKLIQHTPVARLDLLPADKSLRDLDVLFHDLGKRNRLAKVAGGLEHDYDRIIIDCPPGLTDTSDQVLRAADLVVVPLIPSVLSRRAYEDLKEHVAQKKGPDARLLPVFSMVDRRRALHRNELERLQWPVVPMASAYERMSEDRAPIGELYPRKSPTVEAVAQVWRRVERTLVKPNA